MTTEPQSAGGWRETILSHFAADTAAFSPVTVVADPDRLLSEQRLLSALSERGFEVVALEDPVALRYLYESRFRGRDGDPKSPRLVVTASDIDQGIPFDIRSRADQVSRVLSFGIASLFPQLTPGVVAELDRDDLDALFRAQQIHQPGRLGENATRDFILRHVCGVAPELIRSAADLLRTLLRRHYQEREYPLSLDK